MARTCPGACTTSRSGETCTSIPQNAMVFESDADPAQVHTAMNRWPAEEADRGTASEPFSRDAVANVTLVDSDQVVTQVLPFVGLEVRTEEEARIFAEVADALEAER